MSAGLRADGSHCFRRDGGPGDVGALRHGRSDPGNTEEDKNGARNVGQNARLEEEIGDQAENDQREHQNLELSKARLSVQSCRYGDRVEVELPALRTLLPKGEGGNQIAHRQFDGSKWR